MNKVLLIEDDARVAEGLAISLKVNGYLATHTPTLQAARKALAADKFAIVLLDVNLPDGNGIEFCRELRGTHAELPVILLTARTDEDSAVQGLASGATDYVRKPFGMKELLARMQRFTNRDVYAAQSFAFGELTVNATDRRALYRDRELTLTKREFDVLCLLAKRGGNLVSREQVLAAIDEHGEIFDQTLATHISNLRAKLKEASGGELGIRAVYGSGYRLEKKAEK